jgi:DNA end-binding protein Ku
LPASIWSGSISFGLVSIPVHLAVATEKKDISFHLLHRKDGSRIKQRYFCAVDDQPLELEDLARGNEVSPGRYVLMTDADFDRIPTSSLNSVDIGRTRFATRAGTTRNAGQEPL